MQRLRELHQSGALDLADAYLEKYSADFMGLTGKPVAVRHIASEFSAAFFKGHSDHGGNYDVTHSPQIFLLDQEGRLRAELYNALLESMVGIANALIKEGS